MDSYRHTCTIYGYVLTRVRITHILTTNDDYSDAVLLLKKTAYNITVNLSVTS
jgi:phage gp36-like protein